MPQYLSKVKPSSLLGDGSLEQEAEVLSWVNWANQELLGTLAKWYLLLKIYPRILMIGTKLTVASIQVPPAHSGLAAARAV